MAGRNMLGRGWGRGFGALLVLLCMGKWFPWAMCGFLMTCGLFKVLLCDGWALEQFRDMYSVVSLLALLVLGRSD